MSRYMHRFRLYLSLLLISLATSCTQDINNITQSDYKKQLNLSGSINQQHSTRVDDNGFAEGDVMGIYIVDYNDGTAGSLSDTGLRASNTHYTYDAQSNSWSSLAQLYWKDETTPVDIYGYYPAAASIEDATNYKFEVSSKQNLHPSSERISNYEASDLLWGKVSKVSPTQEVIVVNYSHRMAGVNVTLVKGEGVDEAEWSAADKTVQIDNTRRSAYIDLTDGIPVATGVADRSIVMLAQPNDTFRAVVVPQIVKAGAQLLSITIGDRTYTHKLSFDMEYTMGKLHNFTIRVEKSEASGDYQLNISYDGIEDWINDQTSHEFSSNAYVILDVEQDGTLEQTISTLGINPADIQNLKIRGKLNSVDFEFIRQSISSLRRINLESVRFVNAHRSFWVDGGGWRDEYIDDYLPDDAFKDMEHLRQVILPIGMNAIGANAFMHCELNYPLIIPEGVTHLMENCFHCCNGEVVMPHTLEYIEGGAFYGGPKAELVMTDNLRYIGGGAFQDARKIYGTFYLSPNIEHIGGSAFEGMGLESEGIYGDIVIPQSMTEIPDGAFRINFVKGTNLYLHDGITTIGDSSFAGVHIKNKLALPANLQVIRKNAFYGCGITNNNITFPASLKKITAGAFADNRLTGELVLPETLASIGHGAFSGCNFESIVIGDSYYAIDNDAFAINKNLRTLYIGRNVGTIYSNAFLACTGLKNIICMADEPPQLEANSFGETGPYTEASIIFENCILQVPEKMVDLYRNTPVWKEFKNITAYKELAFNLANITTMDKGITREGIIRAESAWEVIESPSWVTVSPTSGQGKALVNITVHPQAVGEPTREGKVVFSLKDKEFTTYMDIRQIGAEIGEDQTVVLQTATANTAKAIPIFIVGEGYGAEEVANGKYIEDMRQQVEYIFSIEPMRSYRDYFTVSTAYAVSPESGINGLTKFSPEYVDNLHGDDNLVIEYARAHGVGIAENEQAATVLVLFNTELTANSISMHDNGFAISWMGKSQSPYPYTQQGCVLHEFVGRAFGKLGPENIHHFTFIEACSCPGCNMNSEYERAMKNGWWKNVTRTNKLKSLPWYHLIFHEKYSSLVDIYEGACGHSRGAYRSEAQSVMGNAYIYYFNTISRELLVRRIKECAGEQFDFEEFVSKDIIELPEE